MNSYNVSVIIPLYNVQETIERCIDSLINQTMDFLNIELILYDDSSDDGTRSIIEKYCEEYENIVFLLSKCNSGNAGKGRNESLKIASADYVMFLDSDDEYCPDMCQTLYNEIVKSNADIVSSNRLDVLDEYSAVTCNTVKENGETYSKNQKEVFLDDDVYNFADIIITTKIFRRSLIDENHLEFPEDKISEDIYFMYVLLYYTNKIVYLKDYVGYVKYNLEDSLSHSVNYTKLKDVLDCLFDVFMFYKNKEKEIDFSWLSTFPIEYCLWGISKLNLSNKEKIKDLLKSICRFEKETEFDDSYLNSIYRIPNEYIRNGRFKQAIYYFNKTDDLE